MSCVELKKRSLNFYNKFKLLISAICIIVSCNNIEKNPSKNFIQFNPSINRKTASESPISYQKLLEHQRKITAEKIDTITITPITTFICFGG